MEEQRPYSGDYGEGSVVTFVVVGAYNDGAGDLAVYSLVETDTGSGRLHRLREKGVGDGAVRAAVVADDLYRSRVTIAGVPASGGSNVRYGFNHRIDDHLGSFNAKYMRYRVVGTQAEYDTLIDEDLYVGVDTLTTAILVGNQQIGYSVVSLQTPMLYQVPEARSRLRVFHGSASMGEIEVVLKLNDGSSEQYSSVSFKGSTEYREVPYGPVVAELYRSGEEVAFARKRGYLPVDSQGTLVLIGPSMDSLGVALLVDTDSNYQSVKFWPDAGATGVERESAEEVATVAVYPNPTSGDAVLSIIGSTEATATVELLTLTGRVVQRWPAVALQRDGTRHFPISTLELASGTYLVRATIAGKVAARLLTVVR
ncbi:MAG: T9SS type A sorting domain-containing protein [Armatimonadetes bacterium]|nr:T9SS type A sorting domain-containing protein [Armatimonadota bacterium]